MYKPKHFKLAEWLPERYYAILFPVYGDRLWLIFDERILITYDRLRARFGPIIMNTWHSRTMMNRFGRHEWRGYRDHSSRYVRRDGTGAFGNISQHRFGRAGDGAFLEVDAETVRKEILNDPGHDDFKFISCIEKDVSWLHADVGNRIEPGGEILVV